MVKRLLLVSACLLFLLGSVAPDVYIPGPMANAQLNTIQVCFQYEYTDVTGKLYSLISKGSGIRIAEDRILTCAHLVTGRPVGRLYMPARPPIPMKILKIDTDADLLLAQFGFQFAWEATDIAEGFSLGEEMMFTGYSSVPVPLLRFGRVAMNPKGIMVHPVYFGDSGGGVFNMEGELIGIIYCTVMVQREEVRVSTLIGYAIPLEVIKVFLNE